MQNFRIKLFINNSIYTLLFILLASGSLLFSSLRVSAHSKPKHPGQKKSSIQDNKMSDKQISNLSSSPLSEGAAITAPFLINELKRNGSNFELNENQSQCISAYRNLFSDDTIKIGIYWGYLDFESQTHDQGFKNQTLAALTTSCDFSPYKNLCGFEFDKIVKNSLTKTIKDLDGKNKKLLVTIYSSSYSTHTIINEEEKTGSQLQEELTEKRWQSFENSLKSDTIVYYIGHARYGSGPDFGPLDPYSYKGIMSNFTKPNLKRMTDALTSTKTPTKVLGLVTCQAKSYYAKPIHDVSPDTSFVFTNQSTAFADNLDTVLYSLESLLGMKCQDGFQKSLIDATTYYSTHKYDTSTYREKLTTIDGFFTPHENYPDPALLSPYLVIDEYLVPAPSEDKFDDVVNTSPSILLKLPFLRHD